MDFVVLRCDNEYKITTCTKELQYGFEVCRGTYEDCNLYLNWILLYFPMTALFNFETNHWYSRLEY